MRILLLNQTFFPDNAATAQHLVDLAIELVQRNHSVDVVSDIRSYDDRNKLLPRVETYKGVRIHRIGTTAFGKKSKFHRGLDYLSFNISLLFKMLSLPRYDCVIGLTTPPWISIFGVMFCKFKGGRFTHWAMDVNPDEAVKLGWVKHGSFFYRLLNAWACFTYGKSNKIIALDRYMAGLIRSKGINSNKICIIPPWAHDDIKPISHKENVFRKKYKLEDKFIVMYSGNFSICHPINTVLESARALRNDHQIVFVFIGGGVRLDEILEYKETYKLDNIIYLPYQEREDLKYSLPAADLHIVSMGDDYVGIVHPSKIYGILQSGRPFVLIGPKNCAIGDIIANHRIGYQVEHGDVRGLLQIVDKVRMLSESEKREIARKSYALSTNQFSRKHSINLIINAIHNSTIL